MHFANLAEIFLIFLPAFIANAVPVIAKNILYIRELSRPVQTELFGKNKTVRGIITGILGGIMVGILLVLLRSIFVKILPTFSDYYNLYSTLGNGIFFGALLAVGALGGDIVKSFFKRRLGYKPGTMFQPWDGIDYMVGAIIIMLPWYNPGVIGCIFLLIIGPVLSLLANTIAYWIGWKDCWY